MSVNWESRWPACRAFPQNFGGLMVGSDVEMEQLLVERAHLRSLVDTLPDLVWLKDPDGVYLACNERFEKFYGVSREKILGRTDFHFTDAAQAESFREHDLAAIEAGIPTMNEEWITFASDGHLELLETIKTPMFSQSGTLLGVLGIGRDITQRQESAQRLQRTIDTVEALIVELDQQARVTLVSQRTKTLLNIAGDSGLGQNWFSLSSPGEHAEPLLQRFLAFMGDPESDCMELETFNTDLSGSTRTISWVFRRMKDASGVARCLCSGIDITHRREKEEQSRLASIVFQQALEAIMVCGPDQRIISVNPSFCRITGYEESDILGRTPRFLSSKQRGPSEFDKMWDIIRGYGQWQGTFWNRHHNGQEFLAQMNISAVRDDDGSVNQYVAVFTDVTQLRNQNDRLRELAHFDSLTGLPNRTLLNDRLEQALAKIRRDKTSLAVCFIDLDDFKPVNDTFGHKVGDELLTAVAQRLRSVPRETDTVARLGGDEFIVILNDVGNQSSCHEAVGRLLNVLEAPIVCSGHELRVHASIGVTICSVDAPDAGTLLRQADQAMYQAKLMGRNQIQFFNSVEESEFANHLFRVQKFRTALEVGEVELFYQPKVLAGRETVVGMEALLRWREPKLGLLTAGSFLPELKDSSLAIDLDTWVLRNALTQASEWRRSGHKIEVSVNIGAQSLQDPQFLDRLSEALDAHPSVPSSSLVLEVVESAALGDLETMQSVFRRCQKTGVRIALDDFGTGYSSLTYFRQLPVDEIKLDRSFVMEVARSSEDLAIVTSVIGLAKAFGRTVVAEGVENQTIAQTLLSLGCDVLQGYGIARPMHASRVLPWLASRLNKPHSQRMVACAL